MRRWTPWLGTFLALMASGCFDVGEYENLYPRAKVEILAVSVGDDFAVGNLQVGPRDGDLVFRLHGNGTGVIFAHAEYEGNLSTVVKPFNLTASGTFNETRAGCLDPGIYRLVVRTEGFQGQARLHSFATREYEVCDFPPGPPFKTVLWRFTKGLLGVVLAVGALVGAAGAIVGGFTRVRMVVQGTYVFERKAAEAIQAYVDGRLTAKSTRARLQNLREVAREWRDLKGLTRKRHDTIIARIDEALAFVNKPKAPSPQGANDSSE